MLDENILNLIKAHRKIGKAGLPLELIRDEQVKVRFTESDRHVVKATSLANDADEAQFLYALAISALKKMMNSDPQLAEVIKKDVQLANLPIPHWMI